MTKLKYKAIRGVDKTICTAEQKIAYNLAFRLHISYQDNYNVLDSGFAKSQAIVDMVNYAIKSYCHACDYVPCMYNLDAIKAALHAGLQAYLDKNGPVAGSYEEIGKMFPAHYL